MPTASKQPFILGVGGSGHDFSAALLRGDELLVAIEDERLVRRKHGPIDWHASPTSSAVRYCLEAANVTLDDIDHIFANRDLALPYGPLREDRITFIPHHMAHAAAAFFHSGYSKAAILILDGHGGPTSMDSEALNLETVSLGTGEDIDIRLVTHQSGRKKLASASWRYITSDSLGSFYKVVTEALGFGTRGQGKTMGLAAYGDQSLYREMRHFAFMTAERRFKFDPYGGIYDWLSTRLSHTGNNFQVRANVAAAGQRIFEETLTDLALLCYGGGDTTNLCLGGGCALNTVANTRLLDTTPFKHIYIYPASGDNGLAVGAAYYGYHKILGLPRRQRPKQFQGAEAYCGRPYSATEIERALDSFPVFYRRPSDLLKEACTALASGSVIGLFRGRSEIGPRALGNRSIIADPRHQNLRDHINLNIKGRESFRPLAPVVPASRADEFFVLPIPSPFMLLVARIRSHVADQLEAVRHVDGTARVQTLEREANPFLFDLLMRFEEISGFPILVNTSFNLRDQPLVETPEDALHTFLSCPMDLLILEEFLVEKHTPWAPRSIRPAL